MKKLLSLIPVLALVLPVLFSSCSGNGEDPRKRENEKIKEYGEATAVQFYRALKVALRYTAADHKDQEVEKARKTMLKIGGSALDLGLQSSDSAAILSPLELLSLAGDLYKAKDVLIQTDEDSLPTILGNICYLSGGMKSCEVPDIGGFRYDRNVEHALIGLLWFASVKGPQEFTFYELNRVQEDKLPGYDLRLPVKLVKSLVYYQNDFPYNGLDRAAEYLSLCEKNRDEITGNPPFSLTDRKTGGEQIYYQLHALGEVLKGLNEHKLGFEQEALADFKAFAGDAEKGGMDNELSWLVGSYVCIKNEEKEKALVYLDKLQKSTVLDSPEREAAGEISTCLQNSQSDKALNGLNDKLAMGRVMPGLLKHRIEQARALAVLQTSAQGKKFVALHRQLDEKAALLGSLKGGMSVNTDSLKDQAAGLVKGLFGK